MLGMSTGCVVNVNLQLRVDKITFTPQLHVNGSMHVKSR